MYDLGYEKMELDMAYSNNESYRGIEQEIAELERELEALQKEYDAIEDEEEAIDLYGEDIHRIEQEIECLEGKLYELDIADLTRDYYRSAL